MAFFLECANSLPAGASPQTSQGILQRFHRHLKLNMTGIEIFMVHSSGSRGHIPLKRLTLFPQRRREEKRSWSLSLRLVYPVLHKPPGATITSRSAVRIRINFWRMVGLYISFGDWVLKVSVLETGHTRYCSISGSDPLRQSYRLSRGYCRKTPTTNLFPT